MAPVFSSTLPPTEAQLASASELIIKDEEGNDVKFGSVFADQKTIVIFIRHFLCGLCQDYISFLGSKVSTEQLKAAGVKLIVIGCGDYRVIKAYRELLETPFPIYADAPMKTYIALGMTLQTLDGGKETPEYMVRSAFSNVVNSIVNAFKMFKFSGGPVRQLGGEFVLGPGNTVNYTHRMQNTKGHSPVASLLAAAGMAFPSTDPGKNEETPAQAPVEASSETPVATA